MLTALLPLVFLGLLSSILSGGTSISQNLA